ncbi:hypothetical protein [Roseinatronobacter alkalisoli]|uniref:Pilus assembly protein n=1 Tax=Roseinatronobacter alkalisoli TaxID=3028235 RepID=A0ABT5T3P7_9RHOB|nr:hypothetical protein [Roseinatronobacter sp. HJB301]MDD7969749.1 hypothetical protein [Roseinatronobacter sp. HJB301]
MQRRGTDSCIRAFSASESGAVTVDWVVLSAAVIGLAVFSVVRIGEGSVDLANALQDSVPFRFSTDPPTGEE